MIFSSIFFHFCNRGPRGPWNNPAATPVSLLMLYILYCMLYFIIPANIVLWATVFLIMPRARTH